MVSKQPGAVVSQLVWKFLAPLKCYGGDNFSKIGQNWEEITSEWMNLLRKISVLEGLKKQT
jgi:hypothetical protein